MAEDLATRRKRLTYRSWHRGFKENDLLLGSFADAHLARLDAEQLDRYEALLEQPDADIFNWMTKTEAVPPAFDTDVMQLLQSFKFFARTTWNS